MRVNEKRQSLTRDLEKRPFCGKGWERGVDVEQRHVMAAKCRIRKNVPRNFDNCIFKINCFFNKIQFLRRTRSSHWLKVLNRDKGEYWNNKIILIFKKCRLKYSRDGKRCLCSLPDNMPRCYYALDFSILWKLLRNIIPDDTEVYLQSRQFLYRHNII